MVSSFPPLLNIYYILVNLELVAPWQMWISKDEYKDAGKVIVHRKCF